MSESSLSVTVDRPAEQEALGTGALPAVVPGCSEGEYESKFVFRNRDAARVEHFVACHCADDPQFPEALISSIYFDTRGWHFLFEKLHSDYLKLKVRVRWYGDYRSGRPGVASFLEVKRRIGASRSKSRVAFEIPGQRLSEMDLSDAALLSVQELVWRLGVETPGLLFPTYEVSYRRRRFIDPWTGARLSVDFDIRSPRVNALMVPRTAGETLPSAVLELKGESRDLPEALAGLRTLGLRRSSFSKYSECFGQIMRRDAACD